MRGPLVDAVRFQLLRPGFARQEVHLERALEASGALSELLQHEMDHLDGVLAVDRAIDRASLCTRAEWERRYRNAATSG